MLVFIRVSIIVIAWVNALFQSSVLDVELFRIDKIEKLSILLPFNAAEGILSALLGLNLKSKERVVVVPRAKLTKEISSKRMCTGGLCT